LFLKEKTEAGEDKDGQNERSREAEREREREMDSWRVGEMEKADRWIDR